MRCFESKHFMCHVANHCPGNFSIVPCRSCPSRPVRMIYISGLVIGMFTPVIVLRNC